MLLKQRSNIRGQGSVPMWEWLSGLVKSLFGGKGTTQIGANKSITTGNNSGTIGHMIVADTVHLATSPPPPPAPPKLPVVEVGLALTNHFMRGIVHLLCITIKNTTDRTLFLGNFLLGTEKESIYVKADSITGEPQQKRQLAAGDKFTFHIDATTLKEIGRPPSDYEYAAVDDVVGPRYKSEGKPHLQQCIGELLNEKQ